MFQNVQNIGDRSKCQDDEKSFKILRAAQAKIWSEDTLLSYKNDLEKAKINNINLFTIKYGYMMKYTHPDEYQQIKDELLKPSDEKIIIAEEIKRFHNDWAKKAFELYPKLFKIIRPISDDKDLPSITTYLFCELLTYSEKTLKLCLQDTKEAKENNLNLSIEILKNIADNFGFESLDQMAETFTLHGKDE